MIYKASHMTKDIISTFLANSQPFKKKDKSIQLSNSLPNEAEKGTDVSFGDFIFLDFIKTTSRDVLQKFFTHGKVNSKANNNIVKVNNIVNSILVKINSNQTKEQSENAADIRISINDEEGNVFKKFLAVYVIDNQVFEKQSLYDVDNKVLEKLPYLNIRLLKLNTNKPHKLQDADVNQLCDELVQHCPKIVTTLFALCFPNKDIIKSWSKFSPYYSIADIWNNKNQALEDFQPDLTLSEFLEECFPYYSVQYDNMNATLQEVFTEFQEPSVNKGFFSSVFSSILNTVCSLGSLFGASETTANNTSDNDILGDQTLDKETHKKDSVTDD